VAGDGRQRLKSAHLCDDERLQGVECVLMHVFSRFLEIEIFDYPPLGTAFLAAPEPNL